MFTDITNAQNIADRLKCFIQPAARSRGDSEWRNRAFAALIMLEGGAWYPQALEDAMNEIAPGRFTRQGDELIDNGGDLSVYEAVARVLERYMELSTGAIVYSTAAAAAYLGLSVRTVKHHIHETKKLQGGIKIGHALGFTQAQLEAFKQVERKNGRPRKEPTSA